MLEIKNSEGKKIDIGTDFFGAIIGDSTRLGANSTTLPGSFIGAYTWILPTVQVRGFIPSEKRIFPTSSIRIEENPKVELSKELKVQEMKKRTS